MTKEEAIEILKTYKEESEEDYWVMRAKALGMAIECLSAQNEAMTEEELADFKKELANAVPEREKGEWIPVTERLPKIADVYRVTRYYPNNVMNPRYLVDACAFDGSDTWYDDNRINHERAYVNNVIAWQENPEPYKEGGE